MLYNRCIYNQKMFSSEYSGYAGSHSKNRSSTSYTFGPHHKRDGTYIHYTLDNRIVKHDPAKIEAHQADTPAWVIADLMLSAHRGQPLRPAEQTLIRGPFHSPSLQWLQRTLNDLSK